MSNGIYIHIPFCLSKCLYCDFNSKAGKIHLADDYIDALIGEMEAFEGLCADTVYIGGGTPTALSVFQLEKLLSAINSIFVLEKNLEFTVESNPATEDLLKYDVLLKNGVNRLSIGIQSFDDSELKALGRIHSAEDGIKAVEDAKKSGFDNISVDIMEAIPCQSLNTLKASLEMALSLDVKHISVYSLIIEEGTPFYDNTPSLPSEDEEREMNDFTKAFLRARGFEHYEISNYAKKGYESRHNIKYWTGEAYYGFGAGAHSYYNNMRCENIKNIEDYINAENKIFTSLELSEKEKMYERFMLGFRLLNGFDSRGEFPLKIQKLKNKGLITEDNGIVKLTSRGEDLANLVFMEFLGDD